jgi:hypothetical protein
MAGESRVRRAAVLLAAVVAAVVFVSAAVAAENYTFRFTAADQAAARSTVIRRADLGNSARWKGGLTKPDLSAPPACMGKPKLSDLVVTGAAESKYSGSAIWFDSEVELLQTVRMVSVDWQRFLRTPNFLSCVRSEVAKAQRIGKVGSIRWIAFPHIASRVRAFRLIIDVRVSGGAVRFFYDSVIIGSGRTEITLTTFAPQAASAAVFAAEERLARTLANRCSN